MNKVWSRLGAWVLASWCAPALATTIDPATFEQLVLQSDLVAVVECSVAGGGVAHHRVVESFKGSFKAGDTVAVRVAANVWEPQFPVALVGQRWLVTAHAGHAPSNVTSHTMGAAVPLWWRNIKADVETPLFQGVFPVDGAKGETWLKMARARIQALLQEPDAELTVLRAVFRKSLGMGLGMPDEKVVRTPRGAAARKVWASAQKAKSVAGLLDVVARDAKRDEHALMALLSAGGAQTLAWVEARPKGLLRGEAVPAWLLENLRERVGPVKAKQPPTPAPPPPADAVVAARDALLQNTPEAANGFSLVAREDPLAAATWLKQRAAGEDHWEAQHAGYRMASYLGWVCARDCPAAMDTLRQATDPYVRAAGAVYGCFHAKEKCQALLREAAGLPGEAGQWVAVVRVSRGDKDAMPRALTLFDAKDNAGMVTVPRRNLEKRLRVLLSNSAAAGGLPQPERGVSGEDVPLKDLYAAWWQQHGASVTLTDPWLADLDAQHVD